MTASRLLAAVIAVLFLPACAQISGVHRQYHTDPAKFILEDLRPEGSPPEQPNPDDYGSGTGIVEFDSMGELYDRRQLEAVKRKIAALGRGGPVQVITFVHGWKNSADIDNGNLNMLRRFVRSFNKVGHAGPRKIPAFGIYLGWHAKTNLWPVDFWHVDGGGHRLAAAAAGTLSEIAAAVESSHPASKHMLVGHSFGGMVVCEALSSLLMRDAVIAASGQRAPRPLADAIILMNPALSSLSAKKLIDAFKANPFRMEVPGSPPRHKLPLVVCLNSEGDSPNRYAFPFGSWLGRRVQMINTNASGQYRDSYPEGGYPGDQGKAHQTTVGWNDLLISHRALLHDYTTDSAQPGKKVRNQGSSQNLEWDLVTSNQTPWNVGRELQDDGTPPPPGSFIVFLKEKRMIVSPQSGWNDTPFWVLRLDKSVCRDHSDLENPNMMAVYAAIAHLTGRSGQSVYDYYVRPSAVMRGVR